MVDKIKLLHCFLYSIDVNVTYLWVPSHNGIQGNEIADDLAKNATRRKCDPGISNINLDLSPSEIKSNVIVSRFGNSNIFQILLVHFTKNVFPPFTIEIFPVVLKFFVFKLATAGSTVTCNELVYMTQIYAQSATFQKKWSIIFLCAQSTITKDQF